MARRLIERGVPFIEIALRGSGGVLGWDTHQQNFDRVKTLSARARRRLGHADDASCKSADCWNRRRSSGWASSAARRRSIPAADAIISREPGRRCSPAAASRAARPMAAPAPTARPSKKTRSMCPTCWRRSAGAGRRSSDAEHFRSRPADQDCRRPADRSAIGLTIDPRALRQATPWSRAPNRIRSISMLRSFAVVFSAEHGGCGDRPGDTGSSGGCWHRGATSELPSRATGHYESGLRFRKPSRSSGRRWRPPWLKRVALWPSLAREPGASDGRSARSD